jgi:UDP-N-acetylmuramoyl-tripeptide--D-alanyl-D-alanine ligase
MTFHLAQIADWLGLEIGVEAGRQQVTSYTIDSRQAGPGSLFFALPGDHADGHDFVASAFERGAVAAVVNPVAMAERFLPPAAGILLAVPDVLAAMQKLALEARRFWGQTVLAITGSAGKTSTKDAVATLLSAAFPVGRTLGNFNNHIGLPLSLLSIPDESRVAVLEMGMNHAGEIRSLCETARPDIGVVTNVGYAHIENFPDGVEGIAAAKRELIESLPPGSHALLNADDPRVAKFAEGLPCKAHTFGTTAAANTRAVNIEYSLEGARFDIDGVPFSSNVPGRIGVLNVAAAVAAGKLFGIPLRRLAEKAPEIPQGKMRAERSVHQGVQIWNDCYNSNPDAARAMLDVLRETSRAFHPQGRAIAVLGEMLELGQWAGPLHRDLGKYAVESGVAVLYGIRGAAQSMIESAMEALLPARAAFFFEDPAAAGEHLRSIARAGDTILFKGSRGTRVELALEAYLAGAKA